MKFSFSKNLLEVVLENTAAFMGVYNTISRQYVYINTVGLAMLNVASLDEFVEKYPHGFRKQKLSIAQHNEIANYLKKEKTWTEEVIFESNLQAEFWGILQVSIFYYEGSAYYFVRITDISSKKENEQQIKDEENRFEALFMHAAIGIIMVNDTGKIMLSNYFADALFGYPRNELSGKDLNILIPEGKRTQHQKTYENYIQKPQSRAMGVGLELYGQRKDDSLFPIEISLSHFKLGETPFYISFINDATFKKKAEIDLLNKSLEIKKLNESLEKEVVNRTNALVETLKSLERSKAELEVALSKEKELGELKSRFVSMASHEFRTPLTAILSAASLIEKYPTTYQQDKRERHTHRIKAAVGNLTDILEEFLSVGKIEEGKIEAKMTIFELPKLLQECIVDITSIAKKGQRIVHKHIGNPEIYLDKSLLRKIVINLCSNALKFSSEDSVIDLCTENQNGTFVLKVLDTGIGIPLQDQKHLFDRFFRAANAINIQGTGLGLHIVARYVELLNGKILLESTLNKGTTFTVIINLEKQ